MTVDDQNLDAGTTEFCAGLNLDCKLLFDPPPNYLSRVLAWDLTGPRSTKADMSQQHLGDAGEQYLAHRRVPHPCRTA